jgi:hypothetical protein
MLNVSPSVENIHMMKHCVIGEIEVSSPSNKVLKNATIKNPRARLASKAKLDFVNKIRIERTRA